MNSHKNRINKTTIKIRQELMESETPLTGMAVKSGREIMNSVNAWVRFNIKRQDAKKRARKYLASGGNKFADIKTTVISSNRKIDIMGVKCFFNRIIQNLFGGW